MKGLRSLITAVLFLPCSCSAGAVSGFEDAQTVDTNAVLVSLYPDSPIVRTLPKNATSVYLATFSFQAPAGTRLSSLRIHRVGVGSSRDFSNLYLSDPHQRLTTGRAIDPVTHTVTFPLEYVWRESYRTWFYLIGDLAGESVIAGGQHAFEIQDVEAVTITNAGPVTGSFPVRDIVFTVGDNLAPRLDVRKGTQPSNPRVEARNVPVGSFTLAASTGDIEVQGMRLTNTGSVDLADLSQLQLLEQGRVVATYEGGLGNQLNFGFEPRHVVRVDRPRAYEVFATVRSPAGRTIRLSVDYPLDVWGRDSRGEYVAVCIASIVSGGCSAPGQGSFDGSNTNYSEVTVVP